MNGLSVKEIPDVGWGLPYFEMSMEDEAADEEIASDRFPDLELGMYVFTSGATILCPGLGSGGGGRFSAGGLLCPGNYYDSSE